VDVIDVVLNWFVADISVCYCRSLCHQQQALIFIHAMLCIVRSLLA